MKNKNLSLTYFIGAHRYTTIGGMCALRGLLYGADVCRAYPERVLKQRQKERTEYGSQKCKYSC